MSEDEKTLILFNLINHIKIVSISDDGKIKNNYNFITNLVKYLESQIKIDYDDFYGFLACKPLDNGSSFEIRMQFDEVDYNYFKKLAENVDLDSSKLVSKSFEVFNRNKIDLSSSDILKKFISFFTQTLD